MSAKRSLIVAVAALGLSVSGYAASAGSVAQSGAAASLDQSMMVNSKSTFTLIRGGGGGGHGGGGHGGGMGGMGGRGFAMRAGPGFRGGVPRRGVRAGFRGRRFRRGFGGFGGGWDNDWGGCIWPYQWGPWCSY
jgi:hypothetical protein